MLSTNILSHMRDPSIDSIEEMVGYRPGQWYMYWNGCTSLMSLHVFLQMIFPSKPFATNRTGERPQTGVDTLMTSQLFITSKGFATIWMITSERTFT